VGYQAVGTRGRALENHATSVRIFGEEVPVRAEVVELPQLSAHAGQSELLRWLSGFQAPPRQTFLVHGEPVALNALQGKIKERTPTWNVTIPNYMQSFDL
jgi:metallo-beta-lactamase family protein